MAQISENDPKGVQIVVTESERGVQGSDGVPPYTIGISDPSNTCNYDSANHYLIPNGTLNTGTVTVTVTDNNGLQTIVTLIVGGPGVSNSLQVNFVPLP